MTSSFSASLAFFQTLPPAPDVDVKDIDGNITDEEKQLGVNVFSYFVSHGEDLWGAHVGRRLQMVEMNVWRRDGMGTQGQTTFEIVVGKGKVYLTSGRLELMHENFPVDMCNGFGTLHGACAAYIVDPYFETIVSFFPMLTDHECV